MTPPIAIVGGGPCGLTLARLLECKGFDYVVYERDRERNPPNRMGGTLDIHPETGQRALREAGLFDAFTARARHEDDVFRVCDQHGKVRMDLDEVLVEEDGEKKALGRPEIDRPVLRALLLDSIPPEKIQWGRQLDRVTLDEDNKRPVLHFADGEQASGFKLVVGADGAWSRVRGLITGAKPQYSGKHYVEFRIDRQSPVYEAVARRAGAGSLACLGPSTQLTFQRQGDGAYRVYLGILAPEDFFHAAQGSSSSGGSSIGSSGVDFADVEAARALFLSPRFFGDRVWASELRDVIRHSSGPYRSWPLRHLPARAMATDYWKSVPGLALAGDAAHLATPNGEGVNAAMHDALELAGAIERHGLEGGGVDRAVAEYEAEMRPRGARVIERGIRLVDLMWHENNPDAFIEGVASVAMDG
ncbi:hypothetical protein GGR56DRAFT_666159 [Xylariaceae sp. FL0804]|nr:hypothetical protein GGR56DRAFT_666159 [Xylariaceae sp. FL0804]